MTYNSRNTILTCLESLLFAAECEWADLRISVVDNRSSDDTPELVNEFINSHSDIEIALTVLPANVGWGQGNNIAADVFGDKSDFLLFCNPDAFIAEADLLHMCRILARSDSRIAGIVPMISSDGRIFAPVLPRVGLPMVLFHDWGLWRFSTRRIQASFAARAASSEGAVAIDAGYASGAMFVLKREVFDQVGRFDPEIFLYFDDVDLGRRLQIEGFKMLLDRGARARHFGGEGSVVINEDENGSIRESLLYRSELSYTEKWWGKRTARLLSRFRLWPYFEVRRIAQRLRGREPIDYSMQKSVFREYLSGG